MSIRKTLSIPNKKINYSQQYRNMLPGDKIDFEPVDHRVNKINAELFVVETPVLSVENYTITATCATEGAVIFYFKEGDDKIYVYSAPFVMDNNTVYHFYACKGGMMDSRIADAGPVVKLEPPVIHLDSAAALVTITNPNSEGDIYFTNGSVVPSPSSTKYVSAIDVSNAKNEIRFNAIVVSGDNSSEITTVTYNKLLSTYMESIHPDSNTAALLYVDAINPDTSEIIPDSVHYTTNGDTPTGNDPVYTGGLTTELYSPIIVKCLFASDGYLRSYINFAIGLYAVTEPVLSFDQQSRLFTINKYKNEIRHNYGQYYDVYYTLDGSEPTPQTGTLYSEPFEITESCTVRVITYYNLGQVSSDIVEMSVII